MALTAGARLGLYEILSALKDETLQMITRDNSRRFLAFVPASK